MNRVLLVVERMDLQGFQPPIDTRMLSLSSTPPKKNAVTVSVLPASGIWTDICAHVMIFPRG
jgi:hypothetical protein